MNRVILMGRLTRDPEVRYSQGNNSMAIARFTVAVDRRGRKSQDNGGDQQTADFINCTAFGKTAEFVQKYFAQGRRILLQGRIQTGSYTNRDGQKIYTTDVIVDEVEFVDSKSQNGSDGGGNTGSYQQSSQPTSAGTVGDGFMNIPDGVEDSGLPFN